jgi:conjugal transfer pilus assembly protein TraD
MATVSLPDARKLLKNYVGRTWIKKKLWVSSIETDKLLSQDQNNRTLNQIALYVDEASEVLSEPFIQLLNKGRGAGILTCLATQTVSDFVARTRNAAEADKILANLNNLICMRSNDGATHRYFAERIVKSSVESRSLSHSVSASSESLFSAGGSLSERISQTESPLVPPELLSALPNGEFFAVVSGGHVFKGRMPLLSFASEKQND